MNKNILKQFSHNRCRVELIELGLVGPFWRVISVTAAKQTAAPFGERSEILIRAIVALKQSVDPVLAPDIMRSLSDMQMWTL